MFVRYLRIQVPGTRLDTRSCRAYDESTNFFTIAPDASDKQQPENGRNQVDSHHRNKPLLEDNYGASTIRQARTERQNH